MSKPILALAALVWAAAAEGAVFTVGPHGTYLTLQDGLDAAALPTGSHEVRIEAGVHADPVGVYDCCAGRVVVSGGWDDTFTSPTGGTTVLDGLGVQRVLELFVRRGELSLRNLTVRDGYLETIPHATAGTFGAGLYAAVRGSGILELSFVTFLGNRIHAAILEPSSAIGGGAALDVFENGQLRVLNTTFRANQITEGPGADLVAGYGAGAWVSLRGKGQVDVRRSTFRENRLEGDGYMGGAGLHVASRTVESVAQVRENVFTKNHVVVAPPGTPAASGLAIEARGATSRVVVEARRNRFATNRGGAQVHLFAYGGAGIVAGDSLVAAGTHDGVFAEALAGSAVHLVNLTSLDNAGAGVRATGVGSVFNTIAFGNAPETVLGAAVARGFNLEGVDPLFATGSGYLLSAASPARDAGTNVPPAGLGSLDLDLGPRVVGLRVDLGADEFKP